MLETATIRPLVEADLPMIRAWRNHPAVREFMFTRHEIGPDEHEAWFAAAQRNASRHLLVAENSEGPLGFVQFDQVEPGSVSDWGFYTRPDSPKGTGRVLGVAALDHAFSSLQLHKVCGRALVFNTASIRLHQRLGFQREGLLRQQYRRDGSYHSLVLFGLLKTQWSNESFALRLHTPACHKEPKA